MNKIVQPIKYAGGAHYMANEIIALLPEHNHRVIGCAGGMAEFWQLPYDNVSEVINDIDSRLINFYEVLSDPISFKQFKFHVNLLPFSEELFNKAKAYFSQPFIKPTFITEKLEAAIQYFILARQSLAGRQQNFTSLTKTRLRNGMNAEISAYLGAINGLNEVHERLRRVVILNMDICKLLPKEDSPNTLFILDPPFPHSTRTTKTEYGPFEWDDNKHIEFLTIINTCQSKFIIRCYKNDLYDKFLSEQNGWQCKICHKPNSSSHKQKKDIKLDSLYYNF